MKLSFKYIYMINSWGLYCIQITIDEQVSFFQTDFKKCSLFALTIITP